MINTNVEESSSALLCLTLIDIQYSGPTMHHAHRLIHMMTHTVPNGAEFVEGLDVEPGALISSSVQHHPHGILL